MDTVNNRSWTNRYSLQESASRRTEGSISWTRSSTRTSLGKINIYYCHFIVKSKFEFRLNNCLRGSAQLLTFLLLEFTYFLWFTIFSWYFWPNLWNFQIHLRTVVPYRITARSALDLGQLQGIHEILLDARQWGTAATGCEGWAGRDQRSEIKDQTTNYFEV